MKKIFSFLSDVALERSYFVLILFILLISYEVTGLVQDMVTRF